VLTMKTVRARWYTKGRTAPIRVVVIHDMEASEAGDTAERVAQYFHTTDTKASAHICVDNNSAVRCVEDSDTAWAAPGSNNDGLQLEIAGYMRQTREQWLDDYSTAALRQAARVTAAWCVAYDVPVVKLTVAQLKAGGRGLVGHVDVSNAYKRTDHGDPGSGFPWDYFLGLVREEMEDDMQLDTKIPVGGTYDKDFSATSYPASFVMIGSFGEAKRARILGEKNAAELASVRADLAEIKALLTAPAA
jgi:N-acetyl-anhydromuramyl-L-alanine amidase AmpD